MKMNKTFPFNCSIQNSKTICLVATRVLMNSWECKGTLNFVQLYFFFSSILYWDLEHILKTKTNLRKKSVSLTITNWTKNSIRIFFSNKNFYHAKYIYKKDVLIKSIIFLTTDITPEAMVVYPCEYLITIK